MRWKWQRKRLKKEKRKRKIEKNEGFEYIFLKSNFFKKEQKISPHGI